MIQRYGRDDLIAFEREPGKYNYEKGGIYEDGEEIEILFSGAVVPLTNQDLKFAENGAYKAEDRKLYCYQDFPLGIRVKHKGLFYKVAERKDYADFANGLFIYFLKRQGGNLGMNTTELRNTLIFLLHEYLRRPVILKEQTTERPEYPFLGYHFISLKQQKEGKGNISYDHSGQTVKKERQVQHSVSFTAYAKTEAEARELAEKAKDFLSFHGYKELSAADIVIVKCTELQSRNIFEVEDYERRYGFDAFIRTTDQKEKEI